MKTLFLKVLQHSLFNLKLLEIVSRMHHPSIYPHHGCKEFSHWEYTTTLIKILQTRNPRGF